MVVAHRALLAIPLAPVLALAIVLVTDLALGRAEFVDPFGGSHTQSQVPDALISVLVVSIGTAALCVPVSLAFVLAGALARLRHHWRWTALWAGGWATFAALLFVWDSVL